MKVIVHKTVQIVKCKRKKTRIWLSPPKKKKMLVNKNKRNRNSLPPQKKKRNIKKTNGVKINYV